MSHTGETQSDSAYPRLGVTLLRVMDWRSVQASRQLGRRKRGWQLPMESLVRDLGKHRRPHSS